MNIAIRKAKASDFEIVLKLNKQLFDYEEQFGHEYNLDWTYSEAGKSYFKKRFENDSSIIFVAEIKDDVIGYILAFIDNYPYRKLNPICEIENMFVAKEYRRHGLGKMLIEKVRKIAKEKKAEMLRVGAIFQNESAIKFYKSQGFGEANLYLELRLNK